MAAKRFRSTADGVITVAVQDRSPVRLEPGKDFETDDPRAIAALEANPDVEKAKAKK
jgi:hypothetical protein